MATRLADIRAAMKTALLTVAAIGVVTDFEPYAQREEDFKTYFKAPALAYVQGWTISRASTAETFASHRDNTVAHLMLIRGYRVFGLDTAGATERDFQDVLELVRDVLRAHQVKLYGGVARQVGPPQLRLVEARKFSDCLVHYAEITQTCAEIVHLVTP